MEASGAEGRGRRETWPSWAERSPAGELPAIAGDVTGVGAPLLRLLPPPLALLGFGVFALIASSIRMAFLCCFSSNAFFFLFLFFGGSRSVVYIF